MPKEPASEGRPAPQPIAGQPSGLISDKKFPIRNVLPWAIGVLVIIIVVLVSLIIWYNIQLTPVGGDAGQLKKITIASGSTSGQIGKELERQSIIRSSTAFDIYTRLIGKNNLLQAGSYRLSPAETTPQIIQHLVNGSVDRFNITFYPGATLSDNIKVLEKAGYSDTEITVAVKATYDSPLFAGRPSSADLEGYIYGETYNFNTGATVKDILERTFAEFYKVVQDNDLVKSFASHNLNLYQGITLASIIQREVSSPNDRKQVAQVFYSRLNSGMALGSDVTYQYIADKTGVVRDPDIDSPYNTRLYPGLPPGPISTPGLTALQAVANPASGDYLYFLSGDDNVTYFAHTYAEHEANVANHCKIKCSTP
jgi:UPF0755 protein